jgi:membrane-associated phospholipid phosphatase
MSYWLMYNSNGTNTTVNNATYSPVTGDPLDRAIRERPTQFGNRITSMGDTEPMIVAIVAIGLLAAAKRRFRLGVLVLIGFGLALLVAWGVRETIFDPYLYPSGHALRATYVAIAFSFVVTSRGARVAAWVFAALIAIYTVRTSGHYSEEVIGGALLGWAMATAAKAVSGEVRAKPVEPVIELRDSVPEASSKTPPTG